MDLMAQDYFKDFASPSFDVKSYAAACMRTSEMSDQLTKLSEGIELVDAEIGKQVEAKCDDLLSALSNLEIVEGFVTTMEGRLGGICDSAQRLRDKIDHPYEKLSKKVVLLERVQNTCELLRCCVRVMTLSKRLDQHMSHGNKELAKAAQTLSELEYLLSSSDLAGIDLIDKEREHFSQTRSEVLKIGKVSLVQGLEAENASQVAMSLQVFYHLSCLDVNVLEHLNEAVAKLRRESENWFDQSALTAVPDQGRSGLGVPGRVTNLPAPGAAASFRAKLWSAVDKFFSGFAATCQQIENLYKVLAKKKDMSTEQSYLEAIRNYEPTPGLGEYPLRISSFISSMTQLLMDVLERVASQNTHARQAFEAEYPKLLKMINQCSNQCKGLLDLAQQDQNDINFPQLFAASAGPFETAYLSRSLSVLFDPVELMFPEYSLTGRPLTSQPHALPDQADLANINRLIQGELSVVVFDQALCIKVMRNVVKAVNLFMVRVERMVVTGSDASQIVGPLTQGQQLNAGICDLIWNFEASLGHILNNLSLPSEAVTKFNDSRKSASQLAVNTMSPLLDSLMDALSAILESMHSEEFDFDDDSMARSSSGYAKELCSFLKRISSEYLSCFRNKQFQAICTDKLLTFCVESWLYNASLVTPITIGGLTRLIGDWRLLKQNGLIACGLLAQHGDGHQTSKHRSIVMADKLTELLAIEETDEFIATGVRASNLVPVSLLLHFLMSRGPPELKLPHQNSGWSVGRYVRWLHEHRDEKERLHLIRGALEAYVQLIRNRGEKEFSPVYILAVDNLKAVTNVGA